jgi:hypothetical protein
LAIWTNWDPLQEIIVGNCYSPGDLDNFLDPAVRNDFNLILKETKEDLDELAACLTRLSVQVHRPDVNRYTQAINLSSFNIDIPTAPIVPRDQYFAYGNTIYQTYTSLTDRYVDSVNYYSIFADLFDRGYNWISQPPPLLKPLKDTDRYWSNGKEVYAGLSDRLLWHTATMFKCGDALITNTLGPGTSRGLDWMKRNLPNTTIYPNPRTNMSNWGHIDHGFFMTDDDTVFCKDINWVPLVLRTKNCIEIGDMPGDKLVTEFQADYAQSPGKYTTEWLDRYFKEWKGYDQPVNFDTNVLVVDSKNVIFMDIIPGLFEIMYKMGITCHVCTQRHGAFWDGGVHCLTLDVARNGERRRIVGQNA